MMFRRAIAVICLASFILSVVAPGSGHAQDNSQENDIRGYLVIQTEHRGLEVTVDGQFKGLTPTGTLTLAPGRHRVVVRHPSRTNWLDQDWMQEVNIAPDDTVVVKVVFKKSYSINSEPFGAEVFMDGKKMGETPLFINLNENEIKDVTISHEGYRDTTVTLGGNRTRFVDVRLKPRVKETDLSLPDEIVQERDRSTSKVLLYSAIGLSVVSGALALYFRDQGNESYDKYLSTGDPAQFNQFYDDAKRFDRYAAASFVTFQVGFVASFYLFLRITNR